MKRILIALVCMFIGLQMAAAQGDKPQDKIELFTVGVQRLDDQGNEIYDDRGNIKIWGIAVFVNGASPPNDGIIVDSYKSHYDDPVFQSDAEWYFRDLPRKPSVQSLLEDHSQLEHSQIQALTDTEALAQANAIWEDILKTSTWSLLEHSQIQTLTHGVFEEALAQAGVIWEDLLQDDNTVIKVSANGNLLYVVNDWWLHLIDLPANVVVVISYTNGMYCGIPDEKSIESIDQDRLPDDRTEIRRCYHLFDLSGTGLMYSMKDPKNIQLSVLKALDSRSPFEYEKMPASIEQHLNPPVIWLQEDHEYIKWDDAYNTGIRGLSGIAVEGHLVRYTVLTHDYPELLEGTLSPRSTRVILMLNALEQILSGNGKWLLTVQSREHDLIRNLSNMYK